MNYRKKVIIFLTSLIVIIQISLIINNNQKSSFRYFIWNIEEIAIGRLISISFFSGLIVSTLLNTTFNAKNKIPFFKDNDLENIENNDNNNENENDENSFEIPPQRDLKEVQPTISVNYRVIKKTNDNEFQRRKDISNEEEIQEDWDIINDDNDW